MKMKYTTMKNCRNRKRQMLLLALLVFGGGVAMGQSLAFRIGGGAGIAYNPDVTKVEMVLENDNTNRFKIKSLSVTPNYSFYTTSGAQIQSGNDYDNIGAITLDKEGVEIIVKFENKKTIILDGLIQVNKGTLAFKYGDNFTYTHNDSNPTLKIQNRKTNHIIRVGESNNSSNIGPNNITNADYCKFIIEGRAKDADSNENTPFVFDFKNNFVVDFGGPELIGQNTNDSTNWAPTVRTGATGVIHKGAGVRVRHGTIELTDVTMRRFCTEFGSTVGLLQAFANQPDISAKMIIKHCKFTQNASKNGSAVLKMQGMKPTNDALKQVTFEDCLVEDNYDIDFTGHALNGGNIMDFCNSEFSIPNESDFCIRSVGNSRFKCSIKNSNVNHNYGGGIRWHTGSISDPLELENCLIEHNFSTVQGGGICVKAPCSIKNCTIQYNRSKMDGGGIYLTTYTEHHSAGIVYDQWAPENGILKLDPNTIVRGNITLQNGGGIAIAAALMSAATYGYQSGSPINGDISYYYYHAGASNPPGPNDQFKMQFVQNGGKVYKNIAYGNYGGGVYITRPNTCSFYKTECSLDYGEIVNNKVINSSGGGSGGGVAIVAASGYNNPPGTSDAIVPQDVTVDISEPNEETNCMLIYNNEASHDGGGVYVSAEPVQYLHNGARSNTVTTVYDYSDIDKNTAGNNGGGLYVLQGTVRVTKEGTGANAKSPTIKKNTAIAGNGGGVFLNTGNVDMKGATIGGDEKPKGNKAGVSGGGIYVNNGTVTMLSSIVSYNEANGNEGDGGGIYVNSGDVLINHKEQSTGSPSKINYNSAKRHGGGIYDLAGKVVVFGEFDGDNTYRVEISNNTTNTGNGGGIYCMGDNTTSEYDIRMRRVELVENSSGNHGGGIYLQQGKISIINGQLLNNTAGGGGGGVYTQIGNIDINPTGEERQPSKINGNKAKKNGGGLNTKEGFITVRGKSKNDRIEIKGNVAGNDNGNGSGGGAFCMGSSAEVEYITMSHVDLADNEANGSGEETEGGSTINLGCGGGIYLQQGIITVTDVAIQSNKAEHNGGGINNHSGNIDVNGCLIGGAEGKGNQAGNSGGGIYTNQGDIDIEDYVETESGIQRIESKITHNSAGMNGGGADTHLGTIWVNKKEMDDQIEIAYNTAKKGGGLYANSGTIITYNALIHDNTASENGGGLNNHAGDIILHGGSLSNNSALNGHGGGAYTFVGDIDLFQFPSTKLNDVTLNDGTKVFNNIAMKNGGAFNNHTGRVDVRHATIYNNTATQGNGGGIFCEGPHANDNRGLGFTIRLLCSDLIQNKTRGQDGTQTDPTGRGGGIYLKYGDIYAHYSNIRYNEANINGGGIDNHQGSILLYGCEVIGNRAVQLDGGGIYTHEGNITTGPSTKRELPMGARTTIIENNRAFRNGGGINNQRGNIDLNGDRIASNQALNGDGGGVYIANGNITMNGGKIELNSATLGNGGGVYSGGGLFDIHEREENPTPIVLIVDAEVNRDSDANGQNAIIHYHLVDQGKYSDINNVQHGIVWGENSPSTEVVYGSTEGYTYKQGEPACQRIVIPSSMLADDKTYQAKAFFRYDVTENGLTVTKTGYSDVFEFVTYSANPLVVSGAVSNITSTSAQGSGKIMDPGTSPITERGVKIWREKIEGEASAPEPILIPSSITTNFFTVDNLRDPANGATQLLPNQKYYACAYATNSSGTSEGNQVEFTTLKNTPNMGNNPVIVSHYIENDSIIITATFTMPEGTVFGNGEGQIKGFGFVWSTDDDPELISDHTTPGTLGSDNLTFTASYRGARQNICAYVRAYATYVENNVTSASDITDYSITTPTPHYTPYLNGAPVVRAFRITGITQNSATIHCEIYSGYENTTGYGVHLENTDTYIPSNNYSNGIYTVDLSDLTPGTTYYLKAYATYVENNETKYSYGNGYNFTALPITLPNVEVSEIRYYLEPYVTPEYVTYNKVDVVCRIVSDGGEPIGNNAYGINYGDFQPNAQNELVPVAANDSPIRPNVELTNNEFVITLENLTAHKDYWVNAFATNSAGTHTTQNVNFTTEYDKPSVTLTSIDDVTFTIVDQSQNDYILKAQGNFSVTPHSNAVSDQVNTYGVCWSVLNEPSRSKSVVSNTDFKDCDTPAPPISGNTAVACSTYMTQTHANTKYYVRAYASTATAIDDPDNGVYFLDDIQYTPESSFITLPVMFTNGATATTHDGAMLTGRIGSRDSEGYLVHDPDNTNLNGLYGVCWGASQNPTRGQDGASNYVEQYITSSNAGTFDFGLATAGLARNTTYHYRAYSINSEGNIAYGADDTFITREHSVTLVANPTAGGAVSGSYASLESDQYTAVATPNMGYTFTNWTEGSTVVSTNTSYSFDVTSDHTLQANFTINTYTITVAANPTGYGTVAGGGTYNYGTEVTLTATPNTGYDFINWTLNGVAVSGEDQYTITVSDNANYVANFEISDSGRGRTTSRPRDIYPAPAREPWDWDVEDLVIYRENEPPTVTTGTVTDLTATSATARGIVTNEGDGTVTEVGIWWSNKNPEYDETTNPGTFVTVETPNPIVNTQFSKELANLDEDATYYVRAYAKNSHGTGFGNLRTFSYNCLPTVNHNTAKNGGGIYIASGGKILFSSGDINLNEASANGGGIYLENGSMMQMRNICEVNGNHTPDFNLIPASNSTDKDSIVGGGAGIYLDGMLYLGENIDDAKGTHRLVVDKNYAITNFDEVEYHNGAYNNDYYLRNNVFLPYPTNKTNENYFDAYVDFGDNASHSSTDHSDADNSKTRVIVLLSDISNAENTSYSHIGFSVTKGKIPVVTTAKKKNTTNIFDFEEYSVYSCGGSITTEDWMNTITDRMNSAHSANASIFDDARAYIAIHARTDDDPFREEFIYLWDCWTTPVVKYDPALYDMYGHQLPERDDSHYIIDGDGLWHIKDEKGLAWFSANVNRLNGTKANYDDEESHAYLEAVLEADLDMTEYLWVPIASVRERQEGINTIFRDIDDADPNIEKLGFRGKFNGQGHLITGIDCRYISGMEKYGLFGNLEDGAVVENTFVDASRFRTNDQSKSYHVGGIAGLMEEGSIVRASEARFVVDLARANKTTSYVGGIAGQVVGTAAKPATIHSSMAMPEIQGAVDYMGGLVGQLGTYDNLFNSFSNPKFPDASYTMNSNKFIGGLVGENDGLVENCYSRLQGSEPKNSSDKSIFGWLVGTSNNANIKYCYGAKEKMDAPGVTDGGKYIKTGTDPVGHGTYTVTQRFSDKYGFKHRDHHMGKAEGQTNPYITNKTNDTLIGGLMHSLNEWVTEKNAVTETSSPYYSKGFAVWTRTMASYINDDYPVPMLTKKNAREKFNSVGSKDEIYLLYEDDINDMWTAKKFDTITKKTPRAAMYLYDVQPGATPAEVEITNNVNVPLHIHEDIGITQPADAELTARAGVTIKNARKGNNDFTADPNWHLFSSAIQNVPMGLDYHTDTTYNNGYVYNSPAGYGGQKYSQDFPNKAKHHHSVWSNRNYFDPPQTTWFQSDNNSALSYNASRNKIGYFPTNTPYGTWRPGFAGGHSSSAEDGFFDLYCYSEEFYHWINFKREGSNAWKDHWHMDPDDYSDHWRLDYGYDIPNSTGEGSTFNLGNEPYLLTGKGYMMALSSESMMMADGLLNTGDIYAPVTLTALGTHNPRPWRRYDEPWRTLNMIGNPYQSYLDFYEFVFNAEANNKDLLYNVNGYYCYAVRDDQNKENPYVYYTTMQSDNPDYSASRFIHPHQGFFVKVNGSGNIKFTNTMRSAISYNSTFREEHLNYPLVNLLCFDPEGKRDLTTVELRRPDQGGGLKMSNLNASDGLIGAYMDGETYQTLFTPEGINTIPVHFKALKDGIFTLRWHTLHGDFAYLHLIDNLTGVDVDCLKTDEYIFEGKTTDYKSRFKLIFDCTGVEENEDENVLDHFAFFFGSELMVNGDGTLQMFDMNGRCLMTSQLVGVQNSVSLPRVAAGVYLLRLIGDKQTRIQKIVIR